MPDNDLTGPLRFIEVTLTNDRVYVHGPDGLLFRAYRCQNVVLIDNRDADHQYDNSISEAK